MIDDIVHAWFQSHRVPWATQAMLFVTYVHGTLGLLAMVTALAGVLWRTGDKRWIPILVAGVPGAMLLNVGVKNVVQRARPVVEQPLLVLDTYGFPSGHAAGTAALYSFAAAWLLSRLRGRPLAWRAAVVVAAVFMTLWVSVSRLYLGVHFVSDVLAGMLLGTLWLMLCLAVPARRQAKTSR
ncbi:phosphatase PAP2 family protein [Caenimonas sedimenti]|nr:phosphatase PAP2 family protein [Caenimonas sedimenti]